MFTPQGSGYKVTADSFFKQACQGLIEKKKTKAFNCVKTLSA